MTEQKKVRAEENLAADVQTNPNWEQEHAEFRERRWRIMSIAFVGCNKVSPSHPELVAEGIEEAFRILREMTTKGGSIGKHLAAFHDAQDLLTKLGLTERK